MCVVVIPTSATLPTNTLDAYQRTRGPRESIGGLSHKAVIMGISRAARAREGGGPPTGGAIRSPGTSGDYRVRVALLQLWADGVSERIWCGVSSLNGQDALGVNGLGDLG